MASVKSCKKSPGGAALRAEQLTRAPSPAIKALSEELHYSELTPREPSISPKGLLNTLLSQFTPDESYGRLRPGYMAKRSDISGLLRYPFNFDTHRQGLPAIYCLFGAIARGV